MIKKEKAQWEATLKNILYFVDDPTKQETLLEILNKYNDMLPDGKLRDRFQTYLLSKKKDYYDKVDFLISDILNGKSDNTRNRVLQNLLNEIKPIVEQAEKTFWDNLLGLFSWC